MANIFDSIRLSGVTYQLVASGETGSGITSAQCQAMIDESISGISGDTHIISGDVITISGDVITLENKIDALSDNVYSKSETSSKTEIDDALALKLDKVDFNAYSGTIKTKIESIEDEIQELEVSGVTSGTVQTMIDKSISGKADVDDVYKKIETSSKTEIDDALALKLDKVDFNTYSGSVKTELDVIKDEIQELETSGVTSGTVQTMINNSISGKADVDDVYAKTETSSKTEITDALALKQKNLSQGRAIKITSGATADTISFDLPIYSGTGTDALVLNYNENNAMGDYSHAEGYYTTAHRNYAHAEGYFALADGESSHAEGYQTNASGSSSHAEGNMTNAKGNNSHAEGSNSVASGESSHAEGNSQAIGGYSHSEGGYTHASGGYSHSEGNMTEASGGYSHAEGSGTTASGECSHAEGWGTQALGKYSHAEGGAYEDRYQSFNAPIASGANSHAEGAETIARGMFSHAEGVKTTASGNYSHAEGGEYTTAAGGSSHAEGNETYANGIASHAEGMGTRAIGDYGSHAEGQNTQANHWWSHAEGFETIANNMAEHASGEYNISSGGTTTFGESGNTLFSVGNGGNYNARHNAFEIRQNGDIYIADTKATGQYYQKPMIKLQDAIGGGTVDAYTKAESDAKFATINNFNTHSGDTTVHITSAERTKWNQKPDIWSGTEEQWAQISGGTLDNNTLYLVY